MNNKNDEVKIKQINPRKELNDLEKTAIYKFEFESMQEKLSKTQKFTNLNKKIQEKLEFDEFDLPKKKTNLSDTIKLKLSDLRAKINEEENITLPTTKNKKSLYDTVIIKLDDLINNKKNHLKKKKMVKVIDTTNLNIKKSLINKNVHNNINLDNKDLSK